MMLSTVQRGAAAETLAAEFLALRGLAIVGRNLRCRLGELDIVCLDREVMVIVEVRQRAGTRFGGAAASVTWRKQRRLVRAALYHWQRLPEWRSRALRFDVVALQPGADGAPEIAWIKDAFRAT